ncbi:MAG: hypothetical protein R3B06_32145 [Kofleriaceae bacterium]
MRLGLTIALVLVTASAGAAAPRRDGRAVRVPRTLAVGATPTAVCAVDEDGGVCFAPVEVGASATVLTRAGDNLGTTVITRVEPIVTGCNTVGSYGIDIDRRRLPTVDGGELTLVVGMALDPDARLVEVSDLPGVPEQTATSTVVDADGDGRPDVAMVRFGCDAAGQPGRRFGTSHTCTATLVASGSLWRQVRAERTANCLR